MIISYVVFQHTNEFNYFSDIILNLRLEVMKISHLKIMVYKLI